MDPIPLRADPWRLGEVRRKSFVRASTALFMAYKTDARAYSIYRQNWADDSDCDKTIKAASNPTATTDYPQIQSQRVLPMLAPDAASSKLLNLAHKLDLTGITSIRIPLIGHLGRPQQVAFVTEGGVLPVVDLSTGAATLGPTKKLAVGISLTQEVQDGSAGNAAAIIGQAIAISAEQSIDMALFSNTAETAAAPAGLLYGVTPIPSTSTPGAGLTGAAADVAALAQAIGNNGISTDGIIIITTPTLATKLRFFGGPNFEDRIFSSAYLAAGTLIGIVPQGLAVGYDGSVKIEINNVATFHAEDTTPANIGTPGSPSTVAAPAISAWQSNLLVLKIRANVAWCIQSGAIAVVTGCDWT